jgi:putative DNA primase/helicase
VGSESGGIHFFGATSTGKTSALVVGGSVCGGGGKAGFAQTWRTTINGLEATAEAHNDGTLFLDELAQVDPRDAAETAYLLANGQGKARMTRSIAERRKLMWSLLFVSSGELTLAEHASSAGKQVKGGVEVRLINIDADAGKGLAQVRH